MIPFCFFSRRWLSVWLALATGLAVAEGAAGKRPQVTIRGLYGGVPADVQEGSATLADYGVNAIWYHSGNVTPERLRLVQAQGAKFFAEFNTLHVAAYLKEHPDASPIGPDGQVSPPPEGWQGICPTHPGYRKNRMDAFRQILTDFAVDGIWLDYHHSQASWERPVPNMPDTCFCERCRTQFQRDTGIRLPTGPGAEQARRLLGEHRGAWVQWRCDVLTDWVREFREILNATRPGALLGTFHAPWNDTERDGALRDKLAIDLRAQARYLDVFSPMPYHARFGHVHDLQKIANQIAWLGQHLGVEGKPGERLRIWPIVQLSDVAVGDPVPVEQVQAVLEHGSRPPATGVTVFAASALRQNPAKAAELKAYYRSIAP